MARPNEPDPGQRTHLFAPNLRCDTHLEFMARSSLGRHAWRKLPTPETHREGSGWVALMQAAALLRGKLPQAKVLAGLRVRKLPALTPGDFMVRLAALVDGLKAQWRHGDEDLRPAAADAQTLACLTGPAGLSWALVVGWDLMPHATPPVCTATGSGDGQTQAAGLLLLDPRLAGPWATHFNARLLVGEKRWLGLDGETQPCELIGLLELRAQ